MQKIQKKYLLNNLNTLRCKSIASNFIELTDIDILPKLRNFIKKNKTRFFVLGGGSNLILPEYYEGLVIYNKLNGIDCILDNRDYVLVRAMAGVIWDDFVAYTLEKGWFGLENLSLIPGTVGASPIQNIGAYGVEVGDFIDYVEAYDIKNNSIIKMNKNDCNFSYRHSIFKTEANYIVISVVFKLFKLAQLNCDYFDVVKCMEGLDNPTALDLRNCIIEIRRNKLPDPQDIGNVGSFFHNPILTNIRVEKLKKDYPKLPVYPIDNLNSKISAGWLIDNLGLKGFRKGNLGIYQKQALVIVNYNITTQSEVLAFAKLIQDKVKVKYDIFLNIEPIIILED